VVATPGRWRPYETGLPRSVYVLQSGLVVNALGNGAAAPFMVIYLHDVRGLPIAEATLAGSIAGAAALGAALAAGAAADRVGPRPTMLAGLALSIVAYVLYPLVGSTREAYPVAALAGTGIGTWLTMQSTLLAAITPAPLRPRAFAQQRVAANVGLGLGGAIGGLLVAGSDAQSFTRLFVFNAATFAVYGIALTRIELPAGRDRAAAARGSYGAVLRDRPFARLVTINFLLVVAGVALLASLLPVYAHDVAGIDARAIGLLFLLNSALIIAIQLPITRAHEGHRRSTGLALNAVLFATAWLLAEAAGHGAGLALLTLAVLVFAIGECLNDTIVGPLVADLAPDDRRGRYMGANAFSWQLGFIVGPALGGLLLGADQDALWPVAAAALLGAALLALRLERELPEAARRTPPGPVSRARARRSSG
jgi:MFS family permease